ncbi:MAG: alpha/beta fold hydrolase [Pyrinomonadaceae bacterium]|nr:alpha/beta fold hydrolase [Pyrinomonadaceae bacterium]
MTTVSAQRAGDLKIEPYTFKTNGGQMVEAELGKIYVPERHAKPNGKLIELAFVRFKSTAKTSSIPIIYLAGGPGGSGVNLAKGARFTLFMAMREFGDVIALDQRGAGLSKPNLTCKENLDYPLDKAAEKAEALRLYQEKSKSCAEFWRKQAVDLTAYNSNENADDLEVLRKALGVKQITLWGSSYGTHLGLTFIRRHEKNVYRAVFSGVEGADDTFKLPSTLNAQLKLVSDLVKKNSILNEKIPDFIELVKRVFAKLEKEPVEVEIKNGKIKLGKFDIQQLTIALLGDRSGKEILPALFYDFDKGDYDSFYVKYFAQLIAQQRLDSIGSAMAFAMDCASFASKPRLARINREGRNSILGDSPDFPLPDVCTAWGNLKLDNSFRRPVKSKVKVLFLSGTFDGRTPRRNAEEVLKGFPNGHHVLIEGAGHGDELFTSSPKIKDVMLEFMRDVPLSTYKITLSEIKFQPIQSKE